MALRNSTQLRSFLTRLRTTGGTGNSSFATSTIPKLKPHAATAADVHANEPYIKLWPLRGEFAPVYVALGLIMMSMSLGIHTALHHLKWAPNVRVKKSLRETVPEVMVPERVVEEADHFISDSFFRKVAHVQDFDRQQVMANPISGDAYVSKHRLRAETLKHVGVEPSNRD